MHYLVPHKIKKGSVYPFFKNYGHFVQIAEIFFFS